VEAVCTVKGNKEKIVSEKFVFHEGRALKSHGDHQTWFGFRGREEEGGEKKKQSWESQKRGAGFLICSQSATHDRRRKEALMRRNKRWTS